MWTSDRFDKQLSQSYSSYFLLENNRLACAILDEGEASLKALQEIRLDELLTKENQLNKAFSKLHFAKLDFYQSRIAIQHGPASLLPQFTESKNHTDLVQMELGPIHEDEILIQQNLTQFNGTLSSKIQQFIPSTIERNLPNAEVHLIGKSVMEEMLRLSKFEESRQLQWVLSPFQSTLVVVRHGKLELFNQFKVECTEDLLYYTLNVLEQLNEDPKFTKCWITGQIKELKIDLNLCQQYLPESCFRNEIQGLQCGLVSDVVINRNFTLLNQFLCA